MNLEEMEALTNKEIFNDISEIVEKSTPQQLGGRISGYKRKKVAQSRLTALGIILTQTLKIEELTLTIIQEAEKKLFGITSNVNDYKANSFFANRLDKNRTAEKKIYEETMKKVYAITTDEYIKERIEYMEFVKNNLSKKITNALKMVKS